MKLPLRGVQDTQMYLFGFFFDQNFDVLNAESSLDEEKSIFKRIIQDVLTVYCHAV